MGGWVGQGGGGESERARESRPDQTRSDQTRPDQRNSKQKSASRGSHSTCTFSLTPTPYGWLRLLPDIDGVEVKIGPIKNFATAKIKAEMKYAGSTHQPYAYLVDMLRCSMLCSSDVQIMNLLRKLEEMPEVVMVRLKNYFSPESLDTTHFRRIGVTIKYSFGADEREGNTRGAFWRSGKGGEGRQGARGGKSRAETRFWVRG